MYIYNVAGSVDWKWSDYYGLYEKVEKFEGPFCEGN